MERLVSVPHDKIVQQNVERVVECEVPFDRIVEVPVDREVIHEIEVERPIYREAERPIYREVERPVMREVTRPMMRRVDRPVVREVERPIIHEVEHRVPVVREEVRVERPSSYHYIPPAASSAAVGRRTLSPVRAGDYLPPARSLGATSGAAARALDAADGVMDGKYYGRDIRIVRDLR
eukprot:TRINITY_DN5046_c0_g1_i1.p4 TRINITY_DN5046_c0_g1~~TRINITY_DN5046_c0_g1_i1.p4  ORF type:complete len:179 (+),score=35.25 TRINITY_DN5046_c0_g1_i1:810-1346(+)